MSKSKSVFLTALVAGMLTAITAGLYLLGYKAWMVIVGFLSLYGFLCASFNFCQWLWKEPPLLPARAKKKEEDDVKVYRQKPVAVRPLSNTVHVEEAFPEDEKPVPKELQWPLP